eukprot:gene11194-4014_t
MRQYQVLLVIVLIVLFSFVTAKTKDQDEHTFTMTYEELMSMPINEEGVTEVENTMAPISTVTLESVEDHPEVEEEETEVSEAELEGLSSIAKAIKTAGTGVLKNLVISKGKALPSKLFNKVKTYIKDIKGKPAQVKKLFQRMRKDGILKVIKHYRAKNLQKVGAMGLIKVTATKAGGKQIVKFSTKEFSKNLAIHVFKEMALKKAKGLAKKFAKEYAKHVYSSVVANEVGVEQKKFDVAQKLKNFFVPTDLCWRNSYGRGAGTIPTVCPRSHPQKGGLLCYRQCPKGSKRSLHVCKYGCKRGYKTHLATCHKVMHAAWKCGGRCRRGYRRTTVCTCQKGPHTYGRKILYGRYAHPKIKGCRRGLQNDAGLCYKYCARGFYNIGPVCWKRCPKDAPFNCGALCTKTKAICGKKIGEFVFSAVSFTANCAMGNVASAALDAAGSIVDLATIPICPADASGSLPRMPKAKQVCKEKKIMGVTIGLCCKAGNCELSGLKYKGKAISGKTLFKKQHKKEVRKCTIKTTCRWTRRCARYRSRCLSKRCKKHLRICVKYGRMYRTCRKHRHCRLVVVKR